MIIDYFEFYSNKSELEMLKYLFCWSAIESKARCQQLTSCDIDFLAWDEYNSMYRVIQKEC